MSLTSCIISPYYKDCDGYALKNYKGVMYRHHRLVYQLHHNCSLSSMQGLVVMHLCDNPSCINIDHLRLGTIQDNMNDMVSKNRQTHKLLEDQVLAIRSSSLSTRELIKIYPVSRYTIQDIQAGRTWKHLL